MSEVCPFCFNEIENKAVVCPFCTREIADLESVYGPPLTPRDHLSMARGRVNVRGWELGAKLLFLVPLALFLGLPFLPIIGCAGLVVGLLYLAIRALSSVNTGGRSN